MLEKTLESLLDCKEIQPVYPKGDQSWIFIGRTDAEAETPILWPPDVKNWLFAKDSNAQKEWTLRRRGDRGWVDWMASLTWWTWVWVSSRSWWWTGRPVTLQSMGSQRVRHDCVTELDWTYIWIKKMCYKHLLYPFIPCFHVLAIVSSAIMNTGVQVSFLIRVSSGYMPRSICPGNAGLQDDMVALFLFF